MAFDAKTNWKYDDPVMEDDFIRWEKGIKEAHDLVDAVGTDLNTFKSRRDNPHSVTKGQVGLGNVDNVRQASKTDFDSHASNKNNPHGVTSQQITVIPYKPAIDSGNDYPIGVTSFHVQDKGLDDGYPLNYGVVLNINQSNIRFTQYFHGHWNNSSSFAGMWYRHWYNGKGWSEWFQVETTDGTQSKINAHANLKNNPHAVTKTQIGLGNVDNVKQANKAEFDSHNTDNNRHITSAERTSWNNKVDKVIGKQLSTEDYSTAEKNKLAGIEANANNYTHPSTHSASMITESTSRRFVSDSEKANWNAKETTSGAQAKADKALSDAQAYAMNQVATGSTADPNTTQEAYILTNHANGPGGGIYWHIHTFFYSSKTGNRAQTAVSYSGTTPRMMIRHNYGGTWSSWIEVDSTTGAQSKVDSHANNKANPHGVTKAQIGLGNVDNVRQAAKTEFERFVNSYNVPTLFNGVKDISKLPAGLYVCSTTEMSNPACPIAGNAHFFLEITVSETTRYYSLRRSFDNRMWVSSVHSGVYRDWKEIVTDESAEWINLTLKNGAQAYDTILVPQYCRIGNVVYLRGAIKNLTTMPVIVATLPAGYRPDMTHPFVQNASRTSGNTNFSRWEVAPNGDIKLEHNTQNSSTTTYWHPIATSFVVGG